MSYSPQTIITDAVNLNNKLIITNLGEALVAGNLGRTWTLNSLTDSITVNGVVAENNASIGVNGDPFPLSSTQVGGQSPSGNLQALRLDATSQLVVNNSANIQPSSQSGIWSVGRTWTLSTVTDNVLCGQGTPGIVANAWFTKITDGTNTAAVKASSIAATASDPSLVVALSPNSPLPTGTNTIGALVANQSIDITQFAGSAVAIGTGPSTSGTPRIALSSDSNILVSQSGVWTVVANIGTPGGLALNSTVASLNVAQGSTTSGQLGPLVQGAVDVVAPAYTTGQTSPLSLTTVGALRTDSSSTLQPVTGSLGRSWTLASGTDAVNAVQSGTWTVAQGGAPWSVGGNVASGAADSGNPVKMGGIFNTLQPTVINGQRVNFQATARGAQIVATGVDAFNIANVTGTVVLPTNAAQETGGNLASINTKLGTGPIAQDASVLAVQGPVTPGIAALKSGLAGGVFNTILPVLTNGQQVALQLDVNGKLLISGPVTATSVADGLVGAPTPAQATQVGGSDGTNLRAFKVSATGVLSVDGSATTQPVSGTGNFTVVQATGANLHAVIDSGVVTANIGTTGGLALNATVAGLNVAQGSTTAGQTGGLTLGAVTAASPIYTTGQTSAFSLTPSGALRVDSTATIQPVSGTVTVTQGTAAALAGHWPVQITDGTNTMPTMDVATRAGYHRITDGTNTAAVKPSVTSALVTDPALVVALSPNTSLPAGTNILGSLVANQSINLAQIAGSATITGGVNGLLAIGGNVSSSTTDSGNPVKIGGVFNSVLPTIVNGQRGDLQLDSLSRVIIRPLTSTDVVSAAQSGVWSVGRTWTLSQGTDTVNAAQSGAWSVTANAGTNLNTSLLALDTSVNGILRSIGSVTSGQSGPIIQGAVTTAAPAYVNNQTFPLSMTTAGALRTDSSATTQPISGTIAATQSGAWPVNQGTPAILANAWPIKNTDGTNVAAVKAASQAAVASDPALVVAISPNNPIVLSGAVNQGTPAILANAWPIKISDGINFAPLISVANAQASVASPGQTIPVSAIMLGWDGTNHREMLMDSSGRPFIAGIVGALPAGANAIGSVSVSNFPAIQAVSGTVTANQGGSPWNQNISQVAGAVPSATNGLPSRITNGVSFVDPTQIRALTSADTVTVVQPSGVNLHVNVDASVLPTNAATSTLQTTGNTSLASIDTKTPALVVGRVPVDGSGVTQPVSGTLTANQGSAAALSSAWPVRVTDGTNQVTIKAASTAAVAADTALVVAISPNNPITISNAANGNTGAAVPAQATQVGGSDGTNLRAFKVSATGVLSVDGSATTQPVSGTITANIGTAGGLALNSTVAALNVAQGSTTAGQAGGLTLGAVTTAAPSYTSGQTSAFSLTTSGLLRVDASANPITVNQGGIWTVQPGNTQNTVAWLVQDTSTNTSGTAAVARGQQAMGVFNTTPATLTTGQAGFLQLDSTQSLLVNLKTALPTGANVIGGVTQSGGPWTSNITQFGGSAVVTGTGVSGVGIPRVTVASDSNILATQSGTWTIQQGATPAAVANAWPIKNTDGTNVAAVKAASTAAVASDPALVVAISPNNPITLTGSVNQGTPAIIADAWPVKTTDGTNVAAVKAASTAAVAADPALVVAISPNSPIPLAGNVASGSTDSGNPVKTGGVFNTTLPTVTTGQRVDTQSDARGRQIVTSAPLDGAKATYHAAIQGLLLVTSATDFFTITGSATKTIRIIRIGISGTTNNAITTSINLIKRSTANTGGTSTTSTAVPNDSTNPAATAVVRAYTVNPTALGTSVGLMAALKSEFSLSTVATGSSKGVFEFGTRPGQAIVLRGVNESLVMNLNGATVTGPSADMWFEWTEE